MSEDEIRDFMTESGVERQAFFVDQAVDIREGIFKGYGGIIKLIMPGKVRVEVNLKGNSILV